jgi:cytochrome c-type biogenesis protein CcmH/NrfG
MVAGAPPEIAIPHVERALAANPNSADLWWALTMYRTQANDQRGAFEAFARFRALVSLQVMTKVVMGSLATE